MKTSRGKYCLAALPALAMGMITGVAYGDQDIQSSDGNWKLHATVADTLDIKKLGEAIVEITPAAGGNDCPKVSSVVFEMPAHGHGGDVDPKVHYVQNAPLLVARGRASRCQWRITDLSPSMAGAWRLRLVLKNGDKSSDADFDINAK